MSERRGNNVLALFTRQRHIAAELAFLEDMAGGKAAKSLVAPSLECMQDGQYIEVSGSLLATLARDRIPALKTELAAVVAKIEAIERIVSE